MEDGIDTKYIKIEIDEKTREIELDEIDLNDIKIEITDISASTTKYMISCPQQTITDIILKCLKYSNDAYGVNKDTTLTHKLFDNNIFNRVDLYYERIDSDLFIAIRGTVTMYDVINDINFIQEEMDMSDIENATASATASATTSATALVPTMKVHKGFHQDFKDIKKFLKEFINENLSASGITNLYFTGHSRGSSVSTLSAIYIKTAYPQLNVYNIGFGCPRLGCEVFANYYNKMLRDTTYLFREEKDIVTKLPIYGYYDIMNQYIVRNHRVVSKYQQSDTVIEFMDSGLDHHRLINYMNCNYILPNE